MTDEERVQSIVSRIIVDLNGRRRLQIEDCDPETKLDIKSCCGLMLEQHLRAVRLDERRACLDAVDRLARHPGEHEAFIVARKRIHALGCPYEGGCGLCPEGPSDG